MAKETRKKMLPIMLTEDEGEYLRRMAFQTGYSQAMVIRMRTFRSGWRAELEQMRRIQEVARGIH